MLGIPIARRYKTVGGNVIHKALDNSFLARFSKRSGRFVCNMVVVPATSGTAADVRNMVKNIEKELNK